MGRRGRWSCGDAGPAGWGSSVREGGAARFTEPRPQRWRRVCYRAILACSLVNSVHPLDFKGKPCFQKCCFETRTPM